MTLTKVVVRSSMHLTVIRNVRFPSDKSTGSHALRCRDGIVTDILSEKEGDSLSHDLATSNPDLDAKTNIISGRGGLLLPSDFAEALRTTSQVKATFKDPGRAEDDDDLYVRGNRLICASVESGVTCTRAHVEVDKTVDDACLKAGIKLKEEWKGVCDVQLALFMQDPIFDNLEDESPGSNASIASKALEQYAESIGAIGSAPYVERTREQQRANIRFVLDLAMKFDKHVDFHIDYDLSPLPPASAHPDSDNTGCDSSSNTDDAPLIYYLLDRLDDLQWIERMPGRTVVLGHATRLSLFSHAQLAGLAERIKRLRLPVYFVGLPQSDVYMLGRELGDSGFVVGAPRGKTLDVCKLGRNYGLDVAMGVNNVGNAFTPQGAPDPLSLCPLGVALFQDATPDGCRRLLEAVSTTSKRAIGLGRSDSHSLVPSVGSPADFVILHDSENNNATLNRMSIQSAALDPCFDRTTIKDGRVVAWRKSERWVRRGGRR